MPLCLSASFLTQVQVATKSSLRLPPPGVSFSALFYSTTPRQVRAFHSSPFSQKSKKMPPKGKKGDEVKKVVLGRPGNNLKVSRLFTPTGSELELTRRWVDWYRRCTQCRKVVLLQHPLPDRFG